MELRHLRSFAVVAERLNFRRAAEGLHITQPALSRQIAQLEGEMGVVLLRRDRRRVELTAAGIYLSQRLGGVLEAVERLARETREAAEGKRGVLRVGYTEAVMSSFLPGWLRRLRGQMPELRVQLWAEHSEQLAQEVMEGRLDVAFASQTAEVSGLRSTLVAREEIGVVLPAGHRLEQQRRVALKDLAQEDFIWFPYEANPRLHADLMAACRTAGFAPRVVEEADTRILAVSLVVAGMGVTFLGAHLAHLGGKGAVYRPLRAPCPEMRFYMLEPAGGAHPALSLLRGLVKDADAIRRQLI